MNRIPRNISHGRPLASLQRHPERSLGVPLIAGFPHGRSEMTGAPMPPFQGSTRIDQADAEQAQAVEDDEHGAAFVDGHTYGQREVGEGQRDDRHDEDGP